MRANNRGLAELRAVTIEKNYTKYAEGSSLVCFGDTKVICTATIDYSTPKWIKNSKKKHGWLTAEYGMLPRSTQDRLQREAGRNINGRTQEIQRLISRSLRAAVDLKKLENITIQIDCDVMQADGGTRTASITGAMVALYDALKFLEHKKKITSVDDVLKHFVASVSIGILNDEVMLDLDYAEDSNADVDFNLVMVDSGDFIELQGSAENNVFNDKQLQSILDVGKLGIKQLIEIQKSIVSL